MMAIYNAKLRDRASRIVAAITGRDAQAAAALLEKSHGAVKTAILLAAGAKDAEAAQILLEGTGQKLRSALSAIRGEPGVDTTGSHQNRT